MALVVLLNHPATNGIYTLSLHDALPICESFPFGPLKAARSSGLAALATEASSRSFAVSARSSSCRGETSSNRSEEHTSELQSRENLVCRLLLEKKKQNYAEKTK